MSLPEHWIEKLFRKLSATYGQGFLRQYDGVPIEDVKANWADELAIFQQAPDAIRYGLEHLPPSKAPTVLEFRDLCRRPAHVNPVPALPAPPADPAVAKKVRDVFAKPQSESPKAWAHKLRGREKAGEKLTQFQRQAWREALRYDFDEENV